jgi:taurine dioxygenase
MATAAHLQHSIQSQARPDWPFQIKPLHSSFGAEIVGMTLEQAIDEKAFAKIHEAFLSYKLILFRNVALPPDRQVAFARRFGEVQIHPMHQYHGYGHPEIYLLSNLDPHGKPNGKHPDKGTLYWHTDGSWRERSGLATMMYSEICPKVGGETEFCDMSAAYEALSPEWKARIRGKKAVHNLDFSRTRRHGHDPMTPEQKAKVPPVAQPIVRQHPETKQLGIFLGDHAEYVEGMPYEEGRTLIEDLNVAATPAHLVYSHSWTPGECIVWDNRSTMHRATGFDVEHDLRKMRRCTINGDKPMDGFFD